MLEHRADEDRNVQVATAHSTSPGRGYLKRMRLAVAVIAQRKEYRSLGPQRKDETRFRGILGLQGFYGFRSREKRMLSGAWEYS